MKPPVKMPQKPLFVDGLSDALGQVVAEACQRYRGPGTGEVHQRFIDAQRAQQHAGDNVEHQNAGRRQLGFVNQDLARGAEQARPPERL